MSDADVADVITAVHKVLDHFTQDARPPGRGL
jgi:hypothetical protein